MSDFWAISAFFNPYRNVLMKERFRLYHRSIQLQGARQLVVELVFDGALPELIDVDCDRHIILHGNSNNLMWQKEALLNIALDNLPASCKYVAWIDCDVIFDNNYWLDECRRELKNVRVLQPFSEKRDLTPDWQPCIENRHNMSQHVAVSAESFAAGFSRLGPQYSAPFGFTGYAWAATKEFLQQCRFFSLCNIR